MFSNLMYIIMYMRGLKGLYAMGLFIVVIGDIVTPAIRIAGADSFLDERAIVFISSSTQNKRRASPKGESDVVSLTRKSSPFCGKARVLREIKKVSNAWKS